MNKLLGLMAVTLMLGIGSAYAQSAGQSNAAGAAPAATTDNDPPPGPTSPGNAIGPTAPANGVGAAPGGICNSQTDKNCH